MQERIIDTHAFLGSPGKLKINPSPVEYFERPQFERTRFLVIPFNAEQTEKTLNVVQNRPPFAGMYLMINPNPDSPLWSPADRISVQKQYVNEKGVVGIKSHPALFQTPMDNNKYDPIYEFAATHNLPLLLHASSSGHDYNSAEKTRKVLERYPGLTVILAHFGGANPQYMREAVNLATENPRIYLNTTCLHHIGAGLQLDNQNFARSEKPSSDSNRKRKKAEALVIFKEACKKIPEQIIFGSDLGWYSPNDYSRWPVSQVDKKTAHQIYVDNPKKLFGNRLKSDPVSHGA